MDIAQLIVTGVIITCAVIIVASTTLDWIRNPGPISRTHTLAGAVVALVLLGLIALIIPLI